MSRMPLFLAAAALVGSGLAQAAPVTYEIDPNHTYPAFEADHMGGLSLWRGKIKSTQGKVVYDREGRTGSVEVTMDMKSLDFGHQGMNEHAAKPDIFDVEKYPTAAFKGKLTQFKGDVPGAVEGELTLHGVTKPVTLTITRFKCMQHPMENREVCGADAVANIKRDDFGISIGKPLFDMNVKLLIGIEALRAP